MESKDAEKKTRAFLDAHLTKTSSGERWQSDPMADIAAGRIDTVVVYKIDRLTRSLAAATRKCVTAHGVTLPSVRPKMSW